MNYLNNCSIFYFEIKEPYERCYSTNIAIFCANNPNSSANEGLMSTNYDQNLVAVLS